MVTRITSSTLLTLLLIGTCTGAMLSELNDASGDSKQAPFEIWLCDSETDEEDDREDSVDLFATSPAAMIALLLEKRFEFADCGRITFLHGLDSARAPPIFLS